MQRQINNLADCLFLGGRLRDSGRNGINSGSCIRNSNAMKRADYYEERGLDRIINLSDAVFAFSLTLLTVDLVVPELQGSETSLLYQDLLGEYSRFLYFLMTFVITSAYWSSHHRIFRFIRRYDGILMRLNIYFLLFITLMPFITKLISEYGHVQVAVIIAALGYAIPGFLLGIIWHYASKDHMLIDVKIPGDFARLTTVKNYINPSIFVLSIPFSYINPRYTIYSWLLLFPIGFIVNYRYPDIIEDD